MFLISIEMINILEKIFYIISIFNASLESLKYFIPVSSVFLNNIDTLTQKALLLIDAFY